jgi:hypothetical protein
LSHLVEKGKGILLAECVFHLDEALTEFDCVAVHGGEKNAF